METNISVSNGSHNSSSLHGMPAYPSKEEGIAFCITLALEGILVVLANSLTIALFLLNKKLRKRSLILVMNMAVVDLVLGSLILPTLVYITGDSYKLWTARAQVTDFRIICFIIVDTLFLHGSLLSAVVISVERLYAIYWPLKHRTLTNRAYRNVIVIVWALSLVVSVMSIGSIFIGKLYARYGVISYFCILLFIVCSCNIGIWRKFRNQPFVSEQRNRESQSKRLTKTLLFVSFAVLLSWLPLIIVLFLAVSTKLNLFALRIAVVLNFSSSLLNPVVYALRIPEFRQTLGAWFRRKTTIKLKPTKERVNLAAALTQVTQL